MRFDSIVTALSQNGSPRSPHVFEIMLPMRSTVTFNKDGIGSFESSSIPVANTRLVTWSSSETGHCYGGEAPPNKVAAPLLWGDSLAPAEMVVVVAAIPQEAPRTCVTVQDEPPTDYRALNKEVSNEIEQNSITPLQFGAAASLVPAGAGIEAKFREPYEGDFDSYHVPRHGNVDFWGSLSMDSDGYTSHSGGPVRHQEGWQVSLGLLFEQSL
eukprot:gene3543-biopygen1459